MLAREMFNSGYRPRLNNLESLNSPFNFSISDLLVHVASYELKGIFKGAQIILSNYHNVLELANGK